ncbi:MAG: hypothetical protein GY849_07965, partial [Deltaproteobacteria bacterium]|nr:hypothetical protein [Deltaproteobacteria bacterium]
WAASNRVIIPGDFNGDGMTDLLLQVKGTSGYNTFLLITDGSGGFHNYQTITNAYGLTQVGWAASNRVIIPGDFNGDGMTDLLLQGKGTSYNTFALNTKKDAQGLISEVYSSVGLTTQIKYDPLTYHPGYEKGASAVYPELNLQVAIKVVSEVSTPDGLGGTHSTDYQYGGLKAHMLGRGSLGFAWMQSTNNQTGIVTKTDYNQTFPYIG